MYLNVIETSCRRFDSMKKSHFGGEGETVVLQRVLWEMDIKKRLDVRKHWKCNKKIAETSDVWCSQCDDDTSHNYTMLYNM